MNVVDELVVVLGLDARSFTEGQKRALESFKKTRDDATLTAKELEARGKQGGEFFGQINRQAIGLIATLVGAGSLDKYLSTAVPQIASLGRIADLMGQAAPDLKAFQLWVQQTGGNADTATNSFLKLSQTMQGFRSGMVIPDPTFLLGLSTIGGNINDSPLALFEKFAAWTRGKTGPQQLQEGARLGLDTDTIQAAVRAGPDAAKDLAQMKANLPSDADIKRVQDLQIAFNKLRQDVLGNANAMLYEASPALTGLLRLIDGGVTKFPTLTRLALALATALTAIGLVKIPATILRMLVGGAAPETAVGGGIVARTLGGIGRAIAGGSEIVAGGIAAAGGAAVVGTVGGIGLAFVPTRMGDGTIPRSVREATAGGFGRTLTAREANIRDALASALGISKDAAAGIVSNLVAESGLVSGLNERNPRVKGSKGGIGWEQWTGYTAGNHRRADFEAWAKANGLDPHSDAANFGFVIQDILANPGLLASLRGDQSAVAGGTDFFKLVSGGAPQLQYHLADHLRNANRIAGLASSGGNTYNFGDIVVNGVQDARAMARHVKKAIASDIATQSNGALN